MKHEGNVNLFDIFVFCIIIILLLVQVSALPLHEGRDTGTYLQYYRHIFRIHPEYPLLMMYRTPLTPVFWGVIYDTVGLAGAKWIVAFFYVACMMSLYKIGSSYHKWVGLLVVGLLFLETLDYFYYFNSVASECPQSIILCLWFGVAFYSFYSQNKSTWFLHALCIFLLIMTRPGNMILAAASIFPLFNFRVSFSKRIKLVMVTVLTLTICITSYCGLNYARYGEFTFARPGYALMPFWRIFLTEKLIRPDNGPASQELADVVKKHILTIETFRKYDIDIETFFYASTSRMFDQLVRTINDVYGWDHNWMILRKVAREAEQTYPLQCWLGYIDGVRSIFDCMGPWRLRPPLKDEVNFTKFKDERYIKYAEKGLEIPTENDLIPATGWWFTAKPKDYQSDDKTFLGLKVPAKAWTFDNNQSGYILSLFHKVRMYLPYFGFYFIFGFLGVIIQIMKHGIANIDWRIPLLTFVSTMCVCVHLYTAMEIAYRYPFDPIFILFGVVGLYYISLGPNKTQQVESRCEKP
jgi:hypothetical protein